MKIRTKITLLTGLLVAVSLTFIVLQYSAEQNRTAVLLEGIRVGERESFTSLVELSSSGIEIFASDYTFWDEMVNFVKDPGDFSFAEENLDVSLDTFEADEIFVYTADADLVYAVERNSESAVEPLLPQEAFEHFREVRFAHFFVRKEGALVEYRAATIHPTSDPERVSEPQGFFLVGKQWTADYLNVLQERSGSFIRLAEVAGEHEGDDVMVSFPYEVRAWNEQIVESFVVDAPVPVAAAAAEASEQQLYFVTASFILLLVLVYTFLHFIVGLPIWTLSRGIEQKDLSLLKHMRKSKSEFGVLAQLVLDFSEHELVLEGKAKDDAILAAVGSGLIAVDENAHVTLLNAAAEKLLGVSASETTGLPVTTLFGMESREGVPLADSDHPLSRALRERKLVSSIVVCIPRNGARFPAAVTAAPVLRGGTIIGAVQDFRDITQEEAIEQAKSDFVSLVSHELRTPLTLMRWSVEKLQTRTDLPKDVSGSLLTAMISASARMQSLVTTILEVSKIEANSFITKVTQISLPTLIAKSIDDLRYQIEEKALSVRTKHAEHMPDVRSDERMLSAVVDSIITNAVRYSDEGGSLGVSLSGNETEAILEISNTGPGIPLEEQPYIFTKMFRATNAKLLDPDGTGLGLYISKSFIERLGGSISFTSVPGEKTTFTIRIPRELK